MKTIDEVRRRNLAALAEVFGGPTALATALERSPAQISQWVNAAKDSKSGEPRRISSKSARFIEGRCGQPRGWMDVDHERDHTAAAAPEISDEPPYYNPLTEQIILQIKILDHSRRLTNDIAQMVLAMLKAAPIAISKPRITNEDDVSADDLIAATKNLHGLQEAGGDIIDEKNRAIAEIADSRRSKRAKKSTTKEVDPQTEGR